MRRILYDLFGTDQSRYERERGSLKRIGRIKNQTAKCKITEQKAKLLQTIVLLQLSLQDSGV